MENNKLLSRENVVKLENNIQTPKIPQSSVQSIIWKKWTYKDLTDFWWSDLWTGQLLLMHDTNLVFRDLMREESDKNILFAVCL